MNSKMTTLVAIGISPFMAAVTFGQTIAINTDPAISNITTLVNGPTIIPVTTNATVNKVKIAIDAAGGYFDVGGTETIGFEGRAIVLKPSFTVMLKHPTFGGTVGLLGKYSADWQAGILFSYVPVWQEYDAGIGVTVNLFRLPPKLTLAQASIPIVDTVTPKASVVKMVLGAEIELNQITHEQVGRGIIGISLPM